MNKIIITIVLLLFPLVGNSSEWYNQVEFYLGIENTLYQSPQCEKFTPSSSSESYSSKTTSNLGFKYYLKEMGDWRFYYNQTHASCVLNQDRNTYDASGLFLDLNPFDRLRLYGGIDFLNSENLVLNVYGFNYRLFGDKKRSFSFKCTIRDTKREKEYIHSYRGCGGAITYRF